MHREPHNNLLQQEEKRAYGEYTDLAKAELSLIKQKAKEEWLKEMDHNSAYFHARISEKQGRARISRLFDANGVMIEEEEHITDMFIEYYKNLLGTAKEDLTPVDMEVLQRGPMLTENHTALLTAAVTENEIHDVVFSIDKDKAPGPDGFGSDFFRSSCNIVRVDITAAVMDFFRTGRILKEVNSTVITLVPKIPCANSVGDYRPIACYNVVYKIIS